MRILSWLGAAVILVALGAGGLSAAGAFTNGRHNLVPADLAVAAAPSVGADAGPRHHAPNRRPAASPTAVKPHVAAPARPAPARPAARPRIVIGSTQQALINQDRARYGLGALTWSSCLYSIAVSNAKRMAAQGYISHTNGAQRDLGCGLGRQGGENVGWWSLGINDAQLNSMFMNSPDHRANILGPYHYVATAWAVGANGAAYIAVEFA
jgi:uncharacterized protein YkwD